MATKQDDDDDLVARAGRGDQLAAAELVTRHSRKIFAASYRMLGTKELAEDAVQETFLRMWRHASDWKPTGVKFESWLYRVAMNICLDHLRKNKREAPEEAAPERVDDDPLPDETLLAQERKQQIEAALKEIPERQRWAIVLCHYQEKTNIEAAAIMQISVDALESLLARGRRALRDRLSTMRTALAGSEVK